MVLNSLAALWIAAGPGALRCPRGGVGGQGHATFGEMQPGSPGVTIAEIWEKC